MYMKVLVVADYDMCILYKSLQIICPTWKTHKRKEHDSNIYTSNRLTFTLRFGNCFGLSLFTKAVERFQDIKMHNEHM